MKKLLLLLLFTIPFLGFGQSINIKWEDRDGREFSVNNQTGNFRYSMVSGDDIKYITNSYYGPVGSVQKVGDVNIKYITNSYYGPVGSVQKVGGLKIEYITNSYYGPVGSVKSTSGSVN